MFVGVPIPGAAARKGEKGVHGLCSMTGFYRPFQSQWGKILVFILCQDNARMFEMMWAKNLSVKEVIVMKMIVL